MRQAPKTFGVPQARWRLADLRLVLPWLRGYSLPGISKALTRLKVSRQRGRLAVHSPDPAYQQKLAWVERACALAHQPSSEVTVLYGDEVSLYRQPTLAQTYALRSAAPVARWAATANSRYRVAGAINVATGQLTWLGHAKMGVVNLKRFLAKLRRTYPAQRLILIWDNWPTHLHAEVLAKAAALAIELLWLPTYAPWTNPSEKVWRWLKQDLLHHHGLAERWAELKQQVQGWLDRFRHGSDELLRYVGLLPN